jgi:hypothetical protein
MEHSILPDTQRHEAKGASTASLGQVCKARGDGSTQFAFVSYNEVTGRPTATGYTRVLNSSSAVATQAPSAVNTPIQIEFGPAVTTSDATLSSAGLLTFNTAGQYQVTVLYRFGRTSATGSAILFSRALINGSQTLNSNSISMDNANTITPFAVALNVTATAGMTMAHQLYRDSAGVNNGGLISQNPSLAGWNISPTATIIVDKFVGLSA